jgi:DNA-binding transcriptional ArsR family regulator
MPRAKAKADDQFVITDVATLKALADPLRVRILLALAEVAMTVKELAQHLETGTTRLYYHVNMLERHGLVKVVERRMVSGIEERRYQAVAKSWTVPPEATASLVSTGVMGALLKVVRTGIELALDRPDAAPGEPHGTNPVLVLTRLALSEDEVRDVTERIHRIIEEFGADKAPAGKRLYDAFFSTVLAPAELHRAP